MKVAIFLAGRSEEREVSFAGGRTIYDNINKELFEPIPIFVNKTGDFFILDWKLLYKGTILDFWQDKYSFRDIGRQIYPHEFSRIFDFVFINMHGNYGEDGCLQGLLEWYGIPYSGTGILGSAIGIDKIYQKKLIKSLGYNVVKDKHISRYSWISKNRVEILNDIMDFFSTKVVVKSSKQGSSIGVSVLSLDNIEELNNAINLAFGFKTNSSQCCENFEFESDIIIEEYILGREFSCIVIQEYDGKAIALPPTELLKENSFVSYHDKYLPGALRKKTPIELDSEFLKKLLATCSKIFLDLKFQVYARIDGFITPTNDIYINDPNTIVGMTQSSFIFNQVSEIGLLPSQIITFIIRNSLACRLNENKFYKNAKFFLDYIDQKLSA